MAREAQLELEVERLRAEVSRLDARVRALEPPRLVVVSDPECARAECTGCPVCATARRALRDGGAP